MTACCLALALGLTGCEPSSAPPIENLPWQITLSPAGNPQVFQVELGKSTLKDLMSQVRSFPEMAVFAHEGGQRRLEAYFGTQRLGLFDAKLLAELQVDDATLTALQTNAIDASDWVSPYNDLAFGLHKAAKYYYYPGWQEPQAVLELIINQAAWDSLPADLQAIVTEAIRAGNADMLDDFTWNNARALSELKQADVQLRRFPDEVLQAMKQESALVLNDLASKSDLNQRIWDSMQAFQQQVTQMHKISEKELYNWRD